MLWFNVIKFNRKYKAIRINNVRLFTNKTYVKIISLMQYSLRYSVIFILADQCFHAKNLQEIWTNGTNENELVDPERIKFNSENETIKLSFQFIEMNLRVWERGRKYEGTVTNLR